MKIRRFAIFALGAWSAVAPLSLVRAQEPSPSATAAPTNPTELLLSKVNLDYDRAPNAIPAFEALGLTPETVTTPGTPRELVAELINGVDRNGVLQNGIALETAPFRLLWIGTSRGDYEKYPLLRCLYHFSISAATSKASEDSDAIQLAVGFKDVLWESADHDPYRNPDLDKAFKKAASEELGPVERDFDDTLSSVSPNAKKAFEAAVSEFYANKWRGGIWTAAIAPTWHSETGKVGDLSGTGFTTWTTFAYGLRKPILPQFGTNDPINVQFIAELRYRNGEQVIDSNDKTRVAAQDSFLAAGRIRFGSDTFNGFAEGAYVRVWHGLNGDDDGWRGAIGLEKKIAKNVWLVLSAGQQFGGGSVEGDELFVLSSLRFGTADKAQFKE